MKNIFKNIEYFLKETGTILRLNFLSNIFSILSMALIFCMLSMVISGVWISNQMVELIEGEAEINVFYDESFEDSKVSGILNEIKAINGVRQALIIDKDKAYDRMMGIMGKDAGILEFFEENPFSAFIEVKIELEEMDLIVERMEKIKDIDYIRDNQSVLNRLRSISNIIRVLGIIIITGVGISTLVITSHIIRQGIYSNKEQINTLKLLGAPKYFIVLPFFLEGIFLTLIAGIFAATMGNLALWYIYVQTTGPLPFIPLPPLENLIYGNTILTLCTSIVLGICGSLFGFASTNKN
ncbi:MAG: permease-like cell division protein FtsX [Tissierellales bacterium]